MASDGIVGVSPQWLEDFQKQQAELGFDFYSIAIGMPKVPGDLLDVLADGKVSTVTDLLRGDDVGAVFGGI